MDPLSVTAGCLSLLGSVASTASAVTSFIRGCREARGDLTAVTRELSEMNIVLELLRDETETKDSRIIPEKLRIQIVSILGSCEGVLKKINEVLQRHSGQLGAVRWVSDGKGEVASLRQSLEAYRGALSVVLETVGLALAKEIKADTSAIRVDAAGIKDDIGQILAEIARLRSLIPAGEEAAGAHEQNFVLQRYLDDLTSYAETVCGETLESASVNDAPEGVAKEFEYDPLGKSLERQEAIFPRNFDTRARASEPWEEHIPSGHTSRGRVPPVTEASLDWRAPYHPSSTTAMHLSARDNHPTSDYSISTQDDLRQTTTTSSTQPTLLNNSYEAIVQGSSLQGHTPGLKAQSTVHEEHQHAVQPINGNPTQLWTFPWQEPMGVSSNWRKMRHVPTVSFSVDGTVAVSAHIRDNNWTGTSVVRIRDVMAGTTIAELKMPSRSPPKITRMAILSTTDKLVAVETSERGGFLNVPMKRLHVWNWEAGVAIETLAEQPRKYFSRLNRTHCWEMYSVVDPVTKLLKGNLVAVGQWDRTHAKVDHAAGFRGWDLRWKCKLPIELGTDPLDACLCQFPNDLGVGLGGVFTRDFEATSTLVIVFPARRQWAQALSEAATTHRPHPDTSAPTLTWTWTTIHGARPIYLPSDRSHCAADGRFLCLLRGESSINRSYITEPHFLLVWDSQVHKINIFDFPTSLYQGAILSPDASLVVCAQKGIPSGTEAGQSVIDIFSTKTGFWLSRIQLFTPLGKQSGKILMSFQNWGLELIVRTESDIQCFSLDGLGRTSSYQSELLRHNQRLKARAGISWAQNSPKRTASYPL